MANEITEFGQIATYGGPSLTLLGSALAAQLNSLLIRQGTGTARAWKLFDPAKADFLNTYKVLNPGDTVLINAKTVPMNFLLAAGGANGPLTSEVFSESGSGPATEFDALLPSVACVPSFAFASGAGTLQLQLNNSGTWQAPGAIPAGSIAAFRIQHTAPFSGTLTLTPQ